MKENESTSTWVTSLRSLRIFSSSLLPSLSSSILSTWGNVDMLLCHTFCCCCRIYIFHVTWMTVVTSNSSSMPSSSPLKEHFSGAIGVGWGTTSSGVGLLLWLFNSSHLFTADVGLLLGLFNLSPLSTSGVGLLLGLFNSSLLLSGWFNRRCSHTLRGNHHRKQVYAKTGVVLTWILSYLIRTAGSSLLYMEETRGQKRYLRKGHWSQYDIISWQEN